MEGLNQPKDLLNKDKFKKTNNEKLKSIKMMYAKNFYFH